MQGAKIEKPEAGVFRNRLKRQRDELRRIADEIRVQLHLGGMDAKETWAELEPRFSEFERGAEKAGKAAATEVAETGERLTQDLRDLRERLRSLIAD